MKMLRLLGYCLLTLVACVLAGAAAGLVAMCVPCGWLQGDCGFATVGLTILSALVTSFIVLFIFVAKWPGYASN